MDAKYFLAARFAPPKMASPSGRAGFSQRARMAEDVPRPLVGFKMPPWVTLDTGGGAGAWDDAACDDTELSSLDTWRDGASTPRSPEFPVSQLGCFFEGVKQEPQEGEDDDEMMAEMLREQEQMIAKERSLTAQIAEKKRLEAERSAQETKNLAEQLQHMRLEQIDMIRLRQAVDREGGRKKSMFVKCRLFSGPAGPAEAYIKAAPAQARTSVDTDTLRDSCPRRVLLRALTAPLRNKV